MKYNMSTNPNPNFRLWVFDLHSLPAAFQMETKRYGCTGPVTEGQWETHATDEQAARNKVADFCKIFVGYRPDPTSFVLLSGGSRKRVNVSWNVGSDAQRSRAEKRAAAA